MIEQYTYWSLTLNNPDETDYVLVRNPNNKYVREFVWTPEVGAEGTEHIQGWLRLQRNQTLAFVKKLYPRAHLKPCRKDEYNENCHQYAQKNDDTTAGKHHITIGDPLPAADTVLYKVLEEAFDLLLERKVDLADHYVHDGIRGVVPRIKLKDLYCDEIERSMIEEKSGLEKVFISPSYEKMKSKYWREILTRIYTQQDANEICSKTEITDGCETESQTSDRSSGSEESSASGCTGDSASDDGSEY